MSQQHAITVLAFVAAKRRRQKEHRGTLKVVRKVPFHRENASI